MIPNEAIEAAAMGIMGVGSDGWAWYAEPVREDARAQAKRALEAAAPHMPAAKVSKRLRQWAARRAEGENK